MKLNERRSGNTEFCNASILLALKTLKLTAFLLQAGGL